MAADNTAEILAGMGEMLAKAIGGVSAGAPPAPAAVAPPVAADGSQILALQKSVSDLTGKVDMLAGLLMPAGNGQEGGPVMKAITAQAEDITTVKDAMSAALDRLAAVEGGQVMRKSAAGADEDEEQPMTKAARLRQQASGESIPGMWDNVLKQISGPENRGKALTIR